MYQNYRTQTYSPLLILKAQAELERRRRASLKLAVPYPTFNAWLKETWSEYEWDHKHLIYLQNALQPIAEGIKKKIIILSPPQHSKSSTGTIAFPAYYIEKMPEKRVISGAYNLEYATGFSVRSKMLLQRRNFKFGQINRAKEWHTSKGGFYKAFGMLSGITGTPADLIFLDDPIKTLEGAYSRKIRDKIWAEFEYSVESRAQNNTSFVIILTRWHDDDIVGRILKRKDAHEWEVIKFPALAEENDILGREVGEPLCPRFRTKENLLQERENNPARFACQYQQNPVIDGGNIIKEEYFEGQYYKMLPKLDCIIQSVDANCKPDVKNDYAVITTWGIRGLQVYLIDVWRKKCDINELIKISIAKNNYYKPIYFIIEERANGYPLIQYLSANTTVPVKAYIPDCSKDVRLDACSPMFETKKIFVPENASWLYDYIAELVRFPSAPHDDQVDSTSQALLFIQKHFMRGNYDALCR